MEEKVKYALFHGDTQISRPRNDKISVAYDALQTDAIVYFHACHSLEHGVHERVDCKDGYEIREVK
jgi:hypothetical protein